MFAFWELYHFSQILLQHTGILAAACLLAFAVSLHPSGLKTIVLRTASSRAIRLALIPFAFACFAAIALWVLLDFPNSADEYSCIFLAKCFLAKKLYAATDTLQEFFHFTHIGEKAGKWFSLYPPGWPLLLAGGLAMGVAGWINPLLATLTLVLLYRIGLAIGDRRSALLGCLWVGCSSFYLFHAGSYYSHMACLFTLTLFTWALMRGWFFLAGLALGYAMMTRYLSAMAYATPLVLYIAAGALKGTLFSGTGGSAAPAAADRLRSRRSNRPLKDAGDPSFERLREPPENNIPFARAASAFLAGLAIFNLFQLWFQYQVTGDPLLTPIQYYREHERLGFSGDFTPWQGLSQTLFRIFFYSEWTVPGFWIFTVSAFLLPGKRGWDWPLLLAGLSCGAAYTLYFSFGGNGYGPRYFFESIGVFGLLGARAFFMLWDRARPGFWANVLAGAVVLGFAVNSWNVAQDIRRVHGMTKERKSLYALVAQQGLSHSVVFIRDWVGRALPLEPTDLTRNGPDRNDSVLYVRDLGEKNTVFMQAMPDRRFYLATYDKPSATPKLTPLQGPRS